MGSSSGNHVWGSELASIQNGRANGARVFQPGGSNVEPTWNTLLSSNHRTGMSGLRCWRRLRGVNGKLFWQSRLGERVGEYSKWTRQRSTGFPTRWFEHRTDLEYTPELEPPDRNVRAPLLAQAPRGEWEALLAITSGGASWRVFKMDAPTEHGFSNPVVRTSNRPGIHS